MLGFVTLERRTDIQKLRLRRVLNPLLSIIPPSSMAKSAAVEVYGFAGFLFSIAAFLLYLIWAYLPSAALESVGVYYVPDKQWAIAIPLFLMFTFAFAPVVYMALNLTTVAPLDHPLSYTPSAPLDRSMLSLHRRAIEKGGVPPIYDIPTAMVNRVLFSSSDA